MNKKFCYWSISWGDYDHMCQSLVNSAINVGVTEDFITFTEKPINNCINHRLDKSIELDGLQFFKFEYLQKQMSKLDYDYFVFIDSDHFFVRHPEITIEEVMRGSVWHSFLESPINTPKTKRGDWWGIPNNFLSLMMRYKGVTAKEIRNTNGGFWVCHKSFINKACELAYGFHNELKNYGYTVPEEVSIGYLSNLVESDNSNRFIERFSNYWCSDWTEVFKNVLPVDKEWESVSYMTYEKFSVKPAIVHAMRSKNALIQNGKKNINI